MKIKRRKRSFSIDKVVALSLLIGVLLFVTVFIFSTRKERADADKSIEETLNLVKQQCIRYDNLTASDEMEEQMQLLDKTSELKRCLTAEDAENLEFLEKYANEQRLSGIILVNSQKQITLSVCLDDTGDDRWQTILEGNNVVSVMEYPTKTYVSRIVEDDGSVYDYAALSRNDGEGFVFCYVRKMLNQTDEYQLGIENFLDGYHLDMDGLIVITDGEKILGSNDDSLPGIKVSDYPLISEHSDGISSDKTNIIHEDGKDYVVQSGKSRNYYLYVYLPAKSVYTQRSVVMAYVLIMYTLFLLIIALMRQQETKRSSQLKLKFLRQMSHDIRTPINGIRGMVQIGNSFPDDMEKQKECRDKIWDASGFLMEIVNDVLDMGKMESGEITLEEVPFDMKELVEEIVSDMAIAGKRHDITVKTGKMEGTHWKLIGSPLHLRRVLTNIISNAIKYNLENGAVVVSCREMTQESKTGEAVFELICEDTGIGMSQGFQKHMFEQFSQENSAGEMSYHGTGLGLAIVKGLVQKLNGQIRCESTQGKGTVFYVTLPFVIDESDVQEQETHEDTERESLEGISILLVEDNELNMEIAEFMLEQKKAVITKAYNGQEAVEIFESSKPGDIQIILMDMRMPVMDGAEATREIRSLEREDAETIPIIAMTANTFEEDIEAALQAGMNEHFAKPIDLKQLTKVILHYVSVEQ